MDRSATDCRRLVLSPTCTRVDAARLAAAMVLGVVVAVLPAQAQQPSPSPSGLGRAPTQAEVRAWDLSIGPDGAELPPGSGDSAQGEVVFMQRGCASCHGPTGTEGPAPALVAAKPTMSTNYFPIEYWPFAPSIWDYINRAMPYDRPGNLTANEVYAVMAFLLNRNGIIHAGDVMDAASLRNVRMPHRADYKGPSPWTPDTRRGFTIVP
jgi:S-disulfanyl-L-cysteine oxidoreductase SoxD